MYTHAILTPKNLKVQMIVLTAVVYLINSLIMLSIHHHASYEKMFDGVDFVTVFQVGLVFGLICIAGYLYVPGPHYKQIFTLGYMLPLTGTSLISINVLYSIQKGLDKDVTAWLLMGVLVFLLTVSFGASYRILTYTLKDQRG